MEVQSSGVGRARVRGAVAATMVRVDARVSLVPLGRPLRGGAVVPGGV